MTPELVNGLAVFGRILLGGLFVVGGISHFFALAPITEAVRARGVPFPGPSLIAASEFQVVAGLLLALGWFVAPAAFGLIVFTIAAGMVILNFWDKTGDARAADVNFWQSNLAVIGGLMLAAAQAP